MSLESNSNKICVRIKDSGKMLTSVHTIRLEEKSDTKTNQIEANKNDIKWFMNFSKILKQINLWIDK